MILRFIIFWAFFALVTKCNLTRGKKCVNFSDENRAAWGMNKNFSQIQSINNSTFSTQARLKLQKQLKTSNCFDTFKKFLFESDNHVRLKIRHGKKREKNEVKCLISVKLIVHSACCQRKTLSCRYLSEIVESFLKKSVQPEPVKCIDVLTYSLDLLGSFHPRNFPISLEMKQPTRLRQSKCYSKFIRLNISLQFSDWFLIMSPLFCYRR